MKSFIYPALFIFIFSLLLAVPTAGIAQDNEVDDIHLFQSFFRDTPITTALYGNAFGNYTNFDFFNSTRAGFQAGYGVTPDIEVSAGLYYSSLDFDGVGQETGIEDVPVYGRYKFMDEDTKISGGAFVRLPVGSETIGEGNLDFGIWGALRHPVSEWVTITGTLGIDFLETPIGDREASLNLGGGVIYLATDRLNLIGELKIQSDIDYSAFSGGLDYRLADILHARANLLLGLDNGAPDYGVQGGLLLSL